MNNRWLVVCGALGLLGALLGGAGCKASTCESVCEGKNDCEGATQTPDCQAACDVAREEADVSGCTDAYNALIDCEGAISVCTADTFCTAQSAAYLKCVTDACSEDPEKCSG